MRQYVFIGLSSFAFSMIETIAPVTDQIIAIDTDANKIERIKDMADAAYTVEIIDEAALRKIIPEGVDVAVVDLTGDIESEIMVIHYLQKLGVEEIIAKSDSDAHSEILGIVGATRIVNADREAAARIAPLVLSSSLSNFIPISGDLVMAEIMVPDQIVGETVIDADLRRKYNINVIAVRDAGASEHHNFDGSYRFRQQDLLLVVGKEQDVFLFSGISNFSGKRSNTSFFATAFKTFFKTKKKKNL